MTNAPDHSAADAKAGAAPAEAAGPADARQPDVKKRKTRVLVVDDHEDSAELLLELLSGRACETRVANDGFGALALAEAFVPDVALLDIGLPDMDGYELGARLRQIPSLRGVRLVALTGYSGQAEQARALEAGFQAHIEKPVDMGALLALLDRWA